MVEEGSGRVYSGEESSDVICMYTCVQCIY